jgi:hypothetical protein
MCGCAGGCANLQMCKCADVQMCGGVDVWMCGRMCEFVPHVRDADVRM